MNTNHTRSLLDILFRCVLTGYVHEEQLLKSKYVQCEIPTQRRPTLLPLMSW
ncbi:hypothetical protein JRQ81_008213 [Phrynocephalus forsythii]|uniref:Uncharacterized protein n=1 Tax=Phrynocephalus forsythii TaxID=171643 RepID=A0A9Q1AT86_9SAUR|nr:hypothetical protein JRQ81_008213 [Phrynocephalus forsythii]